MPINEQNPVLWQSQIIPSCKLPDEPFQEETMELYFPNYSSVGITPVNPLLLAGGACYVSNAGPLNWHCYQALR